MEAIIFFTRMFGISLMISSHIISSEIKNERGGNVLKQITDFMKLAHVPATWW
jgi:hypothetical protein